MSGASTASINGSQRQSIDLQVDGISNNVRIYGRFGLTTNAERERLRFRQGSQRRSHGSQNSGGSAGLHARTRPLRHLRYGYTCSYDSTLPSTQGFDLSKLGFPKSLADSLWYRMYPSVGFRQQQLLDDEHYLAQLRVRHGANGGCFRLADTGPALPALRPRLPARAHDVRQPCGRSRSIQFHRWVHERAAR